MSCPVRANERGVPFHGMNNHNGVCTNADHHSERDDDDPDGVVWVLCVIHDQHGLAQPSAPISKCYTLSTQGMTCEQCAAHVQKALVQVPGVR